MSSEKEQSAERIKKVAMELDAALEKKDYEQIKRFLAKDCEIEFLEVTLRGRNGVEKWLDYIFQYVTLFELSPIVIMVEDGVFFEEFHVTATLSDGSKIDSKWSEVLEYENYKISLCDYFDRLAIVKSAASNVITRKILAFIDKKTLEGLI